MQIPTARQDKTPMLDASSQTNLKVETTENHLPADHPPVPAGKIGVLLANLGTHSAQRSLVTVASQTSRSLAVRRAAAGAFKLGIEQLHSGCHGCWPSLT